MSDRKKRKTKLAKLDITVPITLDLIGSDNDPCFGKLYDGTASECRRCGDSEVCIIAMGQRNAKVRAEIESKQRFKDIEEEEFKTNLMQVSRYIEEKIDSKKSQRVKLSSMIKDVQEIICAKDATKEQAKADIARMLKTSLTLKKVKVENKTYIVKK